MFGDVRKSFSKGDYLKESSKEEKDKKIAKWGKINYIYIEISFYVSSLEFLSPLLSHSCLSKSLTVKLLLIFWPGSISNITTNVLLAALSFISVHFMMNIPFMPSIWPNF